LFCCSSLTFAELLRVFRSLINHPSLYEVKASEVWDQIKDLELLPIADDVIVTSECGIAAEILRNVSPRVLVGWSPQSIHADGNCLYRSVSFSCYGTDVHHEELRVRTAIEIGLHREFYDSSSPQYYSAFRSSETIISPSYVDLCEEVCKDGSSCGIVSMLALSTVVGRPIRSFFPPLQCALESSPLTMTLQGRNVISTRSIVVMWSSTQLPKSTGEVNINHFVPLIAVTPVSAHVDIAVSDEENVSVDNTVGQFSLQFSLSSANNSDCCSHAHYDIQPNDSDSEIVIQQPKRARIEPLEELMRCGEYNTVNRRHYTLHMTFILRYEHSKVKICISRKKLLQGCKEIV
jgi:hypothetical protein